MTVRHYCIYIVTNPTNTVLYTGVTNHLTRRIVEHKLHIGSTFTSKYNVTKLVYFEIFTDIKEAIKREKQIKAGSRRKKLNLIHSMNPKFEDLLDKIIA
jgi:putative endonuclease